MKRHDFGLSAFAVVIFMLIILTVSVFGCQDSGTGGNGANGDGSHASIVLAAQFSENSTEDYKSMTLDATIYTIKKRLDSYGVSGYTVERQGEDRILVGATGVSDVEAVATLISEPAYLEFRQVEMNGSSLATLDAYVSENRATYFDSSVPGSRIFYSSGSQDPVAILKVSNDGSLVYTDKDGNLIDTSTLSGSIAQSWMPALGTLDDQEVPLTGLYLVEAESKSSTMAGGSILWGVEINFSSDGWKMFNDIAARLYGKTVPQNELGIVLDNELISTPTVNASGYTTAMITGNLDEESSKLLAIQLTSGALPLPLQVVSASSE